MSRQERGSEEIGHRLGQVRAAFQRPAHGVDPVPGDALAQPPGVLTELCGPEEQSIKVEPQIPVMPGLQIKVPVAGLR